MPESELSSCWDVDNMHYYAPCLYCDLKSGDKTCPVILQNANLFGVRSTIANAYWRRELIASWAANTWRNRYRCSMEEIISDIYLDNTFGGTCVSQISWKTSSLILFIALLFVACIASSCPSMPLKAADSVTFSSKYDMRLLLFVPCTWQNTASRESWDDWMALILIRWAMGITTLGLVLKHLLHARKSLRSVLPTT